MYGNVYYYYITNLQGDVMAIVDEDGNVVASYEYDPYGNVIEAAGILAEINPLRYRGYVYDPETDFYYCQSRYYDPAIGRFINADGLVSTGQGILGNNMFTYCQNNPIIYYDPNGYRIVGVGVQGDITVGGITIGIEIVVYFDSKVCDGDDFIVVIYTYGGYELTAAQLESVMSFIDFSVIAKAMTDNYECCTGDDYQSYLADSMLMQALHGIFKGGGSATLAFFAIDGFANFDSPDDYGGKFRTASYNASIGGKTGSLYYSISPTCQAIGVKYGFGFSASSSPVPVPFLGNISYSGTFYSDGTVIFRGDI